MQSGSGNVSQIPGYNQNNQRKRGSGNMKNRMLSVFAIFALAAVPAGLMAIADEVIE